MPVQYVLLPFDIQYPTFGVHLRFVIYHDPEQRAVSIFHMRTP